MAQRSVEVDLHHGHFTPQHFSLASLFPANGQTLSTGAHPAAEDVQGTRKDPQWEEREEPQNPPHVTMSRFPNYF